MSATLEQRAALIAGLQTVLDLLKANPDLDVDMGGLRPGWPFTIALSGYGESSPQSLAAWENALGNAGISFTVALRATGSDNPDSGDPDYYDLDASIEGLFSRVRFRLADVAERRVVGTRVVEDAEWVKLPVPGDEAQAPEGEAQS